MMASDSALVNELAQVKRELEILKAAVGSIYACYFAN